MKPITLTLQAFGPFAQTEVIDFTRLGDAPLFLINGSTGSGKSTLLDAICYALYGKTTGDERNPESMRCDFADPQTQTEVIFEFQLNGKRYRIRRVPGQTRPKKSGHGETTQNASAELIELDGSPGGIVRVASKLTEANEAITDLLGLDVAQFRQVMVLPQGKFRELLMASSQERQKIFEKLFQTGIYTRIENCLRERSLEIEKQRGQLRSKLSGLLESAQLDASQGAIPSLLETEKNRIQGLLDEAVKAKVGVKKQFDEATKEQTLASQLKQRFTLLAQRQKEWNGLEAMQARVAQQRQMIEQAKQANRIAPEYRALQEGEQQLAERIAQIKQGEGGLRDQERLSEQAQQRLQEAVAALEEVEALQQQKSELQSYEGLIEKWQHAQREAQHRHDALKKLAKQPDVLKKARESALEKLHEVEAQLKQMAGQTKALIQLEAQQSEWQRLQTIQADRATGHTQFETFTRQEAALKKAAEQAQQALVQAEKAHQHTRLSWHQGQAAILAQALAQDAPCPVCGSCQHPHPARWLEGQKPVDGAEVEAAQEAEKKARLAWEKSDRALLACRGEIKNLQQRLEEWQQALGEWADRPLSEFKAASQSWEKQVAQLKQQVGQQPEKEIAQQQLKAQIDQLGQEQEQLQEQMAELQTWKATADARLAEYAGRLPESWRDAKALKQQIQSLEGQIKSRITAEKQAREQSQQVATELARQTALLKEWESEKKKLLKRVEQLKQVWQVALAESGLQSLESFTQAQLEAKQLQQMEQSIQEYDQQCIVVRTAVSELQTELKGRQEPDLSQLDATCHTLGTQLKAAEGVESEWRGKWRQLEELEQKLAAVTLEMEALDKQYALYGTLYKVAAGQEGQRVSLQRFVLGVLLDDVLAEATRRLAIMSRGRYQLLRRQGTLDNRSASGLDLEVEDAHTGKTRPVATLSGGESFMAALALALGLSDVVQSYSGGIRLDMLFIDEGFGSLDPESLELAIRTLIDLQASGRMIGIISHVSELKEQMALRLDVKSSRTGSRVVMVAP